MDSIFARGSRFVAALHILCNFMMSRLYRKLKNGSYIVFQTSRRKYGLCWGSVLCERLLNILRWWFLRVSRMKYCIVCLATELSSQLAFLVIKLDEDKKHVREKCFKWTADEQILVQANKRAYLIQNFAFTTIEKATRRRKSEIWLLYPEKYTKANLCWYKKRWMWHYWIWRAWSGINFWFRLYKDIAKSIHDFSFKNQSQFMFVDEINLQKKGWFWHNWPTLQHPPLFKPARLG